MSRAPLEYHHGSRRFSGRPVLGGVPWLALGLTFGAVGAAVLAMFTLAVGYGVHPVAGGPVPLVGVLLLAVASGLLVAIRRNRGNAVLAYVEQAVRLNLPLTAMLFAAERSERGRTRLTLAHLRAEIEGGAPVSVALGAAVPSMSTRVLNLVSSAERAGRLPQALARLIRPGRAEGTSPAAPRGSEPFLRWYPVITLLALVLVVLLTCVFVMPKFEAIFTDFKMELPRLTRAMLGTTRVLVVPLSLVLGGIFLALLARTIGTIFAPGWTSVNPFRPVTDRLGWALPPFRGIVRPRATADACHVMADAIDAGRPLVWAADEAARAQVNAMLEEQLSDWAERMRNGEHPADAATAAGLPDLLAGLLRTARGEDAPELLRFLARYYDARFSRAAVLARAALVPLVAVGTGIPVCLFLLSIHLPLVSLIDRLAESVWTM